MTSENLISVTDLNASVRLPEVWSDQPLGSGEGVEQELLGCVVLVNRLPVVLAHELEQPGALVLPDGRLVLAVDDDLVARALAAERRQEGVRLRVADGVKLGAVLVAHVALRVAQIPGRARRVPADVGALLDGHVVPDTGHLALGDGRVAGAAD